MANKLFYSDQSDWALYVLGAVESDWDWGAVYRDDPITIGMYGEYAYDACTLIGYLYRNDDKSAYNALSDRLRSFYEANQDPGDDNGPWTSYWMTDEDDASWKESAKLEVNQTCQKQYGRLQISDMLTAIQNEGVTWGDTSASHNTDVSGMIFLITIYHQSPAACRRVISSLPWQFTIDDVYNLALNDSVVGKYKNRQDEVYQLLSDNHDKIEDSQDGPPDYGTVSEPSGTTSGSATPGVSQTQTNLSHIKRVGDSLWLYYNDGSIVQFYKNGGEVWFPSRSSTTPSAGQNDLPSSGDRNYPKATTEELQSLIDYAISWEGKLQYVYGGSGRLEWQTSGVTDCSGFVWGLFNHQFGVDIGTYTVPQADNSAAFTEVYNGTYPPPEDQMQPADLIFYSFPSQGTHSYRGYTCDHVELYLGNTTTIGMRGGTGPSEVAFSYFGSGSDGYCNQCWVRRYKQ